MTVPNKQEMGADIVRTATRRRWVSIALVGGAFVAGIIFRSMTDPRLDQPTAGDVKALWYEAQVCVYSVIGELFAGIEIHRLCDISPEAEAAFEEYRLRLEPRCLLIADSMRFRNVVDAFLLFPSNHVFAVVVVKRDDAWELTDLRPLDPNTEVHYFPVLNMARTNEEGQGDLMTPL